MILAVTSFVLFLVFTIIYSYYYLFVMRSKASISSFLAKVSSMQDTADDLDNVSIIISTYNEAKVIGRKIANISELNYPLEKLEVIVYDDASTDGTAEIAEKTLQEKKLTGKVIHTQSRTGLNRSLNAALTHAKHNFVCITDSDVLLEKNALRNSVNVLKQFENVGGVTGRIKPVFEGKGVAQRSETAYRGFYHQFMLAESSLHSAFPGNGPLIVYNKSKVPSPIPNDYGSTDGNIAINVIRHGFRFIYVPDAVVFEPSPETLSQHRLQKIRRAKRLLQVLLHNRDIYLDDKYGDFGRKVFPLKLLMHGFAPTLLFIGMSFLAIDIALSGNILLYALTGILLASAAAISLASKRVGSIVSSFFLHEFYLFIGLFSSFGRSVYWHTIERKTNLTV